MQGEHESEAREQQRNAAQDQGHIGTQTARVIYGSRRGDSQG